MASTVPTLLAYDPAFDFEIAVIIHDGMKRMYEKGEEIFYYITLYNEDYPMPAMPEGVEEGILKGLYKFKAGAEGKKHKAQIFGSGPIIRSALKAQEILAERLRCFRRCLERHQLQIAAQRRLENRTLEHAASDRSAEKILRRDVARKRKKARSSPSPIT